MLDDFVWLYEGVSDLMSYWLNTDVYLENRHKCIGLDLKPHSYLFLY